MKRRRFIDSQGVSWDVHEHVRQRLDDGTEERVLLFSNASTVRRVRSFPADWMELGADDLESLSSRW